MPVPALPGYRLIEFDRYITPDGETYNFSNATTQFLLSGIQGQGTPPVEYRVQRGPFQDGVTPLGFVLGPRNVLMTHRRNTGCRQDYWDARADFLNFIRPNRQESGEFIPGILRKTLPDGDKRDLSVFIQQGPDFTGKQMGRWDEFSFQEVITFIAHDPIFFDPDSTLQELSLPTNGDELSFAITYPIRFSSPGGVPTDDIEYEGTYKSFPTFVLQGPMREPIIDNVSTGERIKIEDDIDAGRTVTISLEFGNKTVVDDLGNNLIGELSTDSDLATFHLAPHPEAPDGINQIGITAQLTTAASRATITWFDRYYGI
jgi:hypothetical protein